MKMIKVFLLFLVLLFVLIAYRRTHRNRANTTQNLSQNPTENNIGGNVGSEKNSGNSGNKTVNADNVFGVMISGSQMSLQQSIAVAKELGVVYYRPGQVFVNKWSGSCAECETAVNGGLKLVLTLRNGGGAGVPSTPPSNLVSYTKTAKEIISKYKPALTVVENEENSKARFYNGTASQYLDELKSVCAASHELGIKCANGGLVSSLVAFLVAEEYENNGQSKKADDYLSRTLRPDEYARFQKTGRFNGKLQAEQLEKGKELLAGYKQAGADYVNFHWYVADTSTLEEAVNYLQRKSGLIALTNEVGQQQNEDADQVTNVMQKITELKLPFAVWFSIDIPGGGEARALQNPDGSLRSNGKAFKQFIADLK